MGPALTDFAVAALAFGVGFASQRGSVCGVLAARQIVETGRFSRLLAFVTASLWALVVAVPLAWIAPGRFALSSSYEGIGLAVLGGALYGLGTVINGACVFGTAARALSGNLSFFAALPGIAVGTGVGASLELPLLRANQAASPLREPSLGGMALLLVAAMIVVVGARRNHTQPQPRGPRAWPDRSRGALADVFLHAGHRRAGRAVVCGRRSVVLSQPPAPIGKLGLRAAGQLCHGDDHRAAGAGCGRHYRRARRGRFALRALSAVQLGRSGTRGRGDAASAATLIPGGNRFTSVRARHPASLFTGHLP